MDTGEGVLDLEGDAGAHLGRGLRVWGGGSRVVVVVVRGAGGGWDKLSEGGKKGRGGEGCERGRVRRKGGLKGGEGGRGVDGGGG